MRRFIVPGSRTLTYRLHHINDRSESFKISHRSEKLYSYKSMAIIAAIIGLFYLSRRK